MLAVGPTPPHAAVDWSFAVRGAVARNVSWEWDELLALPRETVTVDIHCVTQWTKFDTTWTGVSLDVLLPRPPARSTRASRSPTRPTATRRTSRSPT